MTSTADEAFHYKWQVMVSDFQRICLLTTLCPSYNLVAPCSTLSLLLISRFLLLLPGPSLCLFLCVSVHINEQMSSLELPH